MTGDPRLRPGAVLALAEADYCYGTGLLALRVDEVGADLAAFRTLEWVRVRGREVTWDGTERPREVMVRVAAIPRSLRDDKWLPPRYRSSR